MSSFIDNVKTLCKERGISVSKMIKDLSLAHGNVTNWNKGTVPKGKTLDKIADYFGVSTDYLLGKTEKRQAPEGLTAKRVLSELFFSNGFFGYTRKHRQG